MSWREDQLGGGWVDTERPGAFVGTVARDALRVVLPDGRETRVPFDSFSKQMTVWLSAPQNWRDGTALTAAELAEVEAQIREAVTASGYRVTVAAS